MFDSPEYVLDAVAMAFRRAGLCWPCGFGEQGARDGAMAQVVYARGAVELVKGGEPFWVPE